MPAYQVTGPDGHKYRVDAPEGATADDAIAYIYDTHYGAKAAASPQDQSILRQVADVPLQAGTGVAQGIRMITDAFGADNQVSQGIRGVEDYLQSLLSAQAKDDQREIGRIMQEVQDKGAVDSVVGALKALSVAPVDTIANVAGTALPALAGGLAGAVLKAPALAGMLGTGAVMGAGTIKSSIYDATKQTLTEAGVDEAKAEAAAVQAQEYGGENLDQILIGTVLGAAAGATGVESSLIKPLTNRILGRAAAIEAGEQVATKAAEKGFVQGAIQEAIPEAAQAAQEQLAQNLALQRQGYDVPTMRGVVGAGTLEGIAGGVLGGGIEAYLGRGEKARTTETTAAPDLTTPGEEKGTVTSAAPAEPAAAPPVSPAVENLLVPEEVVEAPAETEEKKTFDRIVKEKREKGAEAPVTAAAPAEDLVELAKAKIAKSGKTVPNYIQNSLNAHFREAGIDRSVSLTEAKNIRDTLAGEGFLTKDPKTDKFVVSKPTVTTEEVKAEAPRVPAPTVTEAAPKVESGRRGKRNVAPISAGLDVAATEGATVSDANRVGVAATTSTGTTTGKVGDESTLEKPSEVLAAEELLKAVDKGGMILNPAKVNSIARDLGLDVSTKAKPVDTVNRIRQAVERAKPTTVETKTETATSEAPSERYQSVIQRLNGLINTNRISRDLSQKLQNTLREQADPKKNPNYNEILSQADAIITSIEDQAEEFEAGRLDIMNRRLSANERIDLQNALLREQEQIALARAQKEIADAKEVEKLRKAAGITTYKLAEMERELPSHVINMREAAKNNSPKELAQLLTKESSAVFEFPKTIKNYQQRRTVFTTVAKEINKIVKPDDKTAIKVYTEDSPDADLNIFKRLREEGKFAEYDPATNEIYFRRDGLYPSVVLHEFVHAGTVQTIRQYQIDPSKLTADQRDGVERLFNVFDQLKAQTGDPTLTTEYENAFSSPYEFIAVAMSSPAFQSRLAKIEVTAPTGRKNLWTEFTRAIANLFGIKTGDPDTVVALDETGQAFVQILAAPSKEGVTGLAPFAAKAEKEPKKIDAFAEMERQQEGLKNTKFSLTNAIKYWMSGEGQERFKKDYQDRTRPLLKLQRDMDRVDAVIWESPKKGGNALAAANDRAAGEYKNNINVTAPRLIELNKGMEAYMARNGYTYDKAQTRLDTYFVAESVNERRITTFILEKPLDTRPRVRLKGEKNLISYAEWRSRLIDSVLTDKKLDDATRDQIYNVLLDLTVNDTANKYADPLGASYRQTDKFGEIRKPGKRPLNIDDSYYDVIDGWDYKTVQDVLNQAKADPAQNEIAAVRTALLNINKLEMKFNEEAGFLTQPVKNLIKLYGWDKYVSLAGKSMPNVEKNEAHLTFNSVPNEAQAPYRGRATAPNSPILMAQVNVGKAATRSARADIVPTLVNLMNPNPINGKTYVKGEKVGVISFADRYKDNIRFTDRDEKGNQKYLGDDKFYKYLPNGDIEVWKVDKNVDTGKKIIESLRPDFKTYNPLIEKLQTVTGWMGQGHTRYQPKFAPYDFVRNVFQNAGFIRAEFGGDTNYFSNVAKSVFMQNRIPTMWKLVDAHNKGDFESIRKLGGYDPRTREWKDPYIRDAYEYILRGGKISIIESWATRGKLEDLYHDMNRSKGKKYYQAAKKFIDRYFDLWMDGFDMIARVDAYRTAKAQGLARKMTDEAASNYASSFAKNLTNFEKKGEKASLLRGLFEFYGPSVTGAVRMLDAIEPAMVSVDTAIENLPEEIKNDPAAVAKYKERYAELRKNAQGAALVFAGKGFITYMALRAVGTAAAGMFGDDGEPPENPVADDPKQLWVRNARIPLEWLGMESIKEKFANIPWGFGMGSFSAFGAQVAATAMGDQSLLDMAGNTVSIALDTFVPVPVARYNPTDNFMVWVLDSAMPSPARGFFELAVNVNGLGSPIHRDFYNKYGPTAVANENMEESYKDLSKWMAEKSNQRYLFEPNSIKFVATTYADGFANIITSGYDLGKNILTQSRDWDPKRDLPFIGSFIGNKMNVTTRDYYDAVGKLDSFKRGYLSAMNSSNEKVTTAFLNEFPNSPAIMTVYNAQSQQLKKVQDAINTVGNYAKTPKERKAAVEELEEAKKALMYSATSLYNNTPEFKKEIDSYNSTTVFNP